MKPEAVLDALVSAVIARSKEQGGMGGPHYRATPSTPSLPYYTGPGGLFGVAGLDRDLISARIQPMGLADHLPVIGTNETTPLFGYLTGFLGDTGTEPNGVCDDPPTAGPGKSCIQTAQFGRFSRQTRTLEVNRLGQQINRGEFTDLRFMNDPLLGGIGGLTVPSGISGAGPNPRQEALMRMIELGVSFQLWMSEKIYTGNPASNTAGGGYQEFPGLDILINTGKKDAITQTLCPALDSDIKNFNYGNISAGNAATNTALINALSYEMRYLRYNAQHMGFGDVKWVFAMRPGLFWEITAIWPCLYNTYRCQAIGGTGNAAYLDAADMVRMRDEMRAGKYLIIDGVQYPVIEDSMIPEDTNTTGPASVTSPNYASDIYIVPLTVRGGVPVTYWQHYDYRTSLDILNAGPGPLANQWFWTDSGRYLWHMKPPANWCVQWLAKIEPRIILRTPQLAGRLTNIQYSMLQHERDVAPTQPYFVNGGVSTARTSPNPPLYGEWGVVVP